MNIPQLEPRLTSIPEVPKAFGEDGGHFYRYYDALADELDEDMVKSLKSQLDGILIFAGLFAGVNSAFLALTLPDMKADPADDTNALLLQLVTGGNSSIHSADDLPSATFTPPPDIFPVNVLFSLSLTLAIISSFLAVLGQQWLVYYRKRSGGGAEHQRWEQLRRYLGGKRWRLEAILDDILPALLQSSLLIFCVALVVYLRTLSETICYIIAAPMVAALAILFLVAIAASWDKWCPFKSPLSHFLQFIGQFIRNYWPLYYLVLALISVPYFIAVFAASIISGAKHIAHKAKQFGAKYLGNRSRVAPLLLRSRKTLLEAVFEDVKLAVSPRPGEGAAYLQAVAAKRVLCTSEDFNALIFTGVNLQAMTKRESVQCLLDEDTVHERLEELGRSREAELASVFSRAFPHLLLESCSTALFVERDTRQLYYKDTSYPKKDEHVVEIHPLKKKLDGVWHMILYSPPALYDSTGMFCCFDFLCLLLEEDYDDQRFWHWVDEFVGHYPASTLANLTVIKFVTRAINVVPPWPDSATGPTVEWRWGESYAVWEQRPGEAYEREEDLQERYLTVQQQRVDAFKRIIDVDWEMLVGSTLSGTVEETVCTYAWKSPRCPNKLDVWLLDQLLLMLTGKTDGLVWGLVAKASIDLLCWFDEFEDPVANSITTEDTRQGNRLRCTRALSKCLQAVEDNIPFWVSSSLYKLVGHLERLVELGLDQSADWYYTSILSTWLEIRDTFGEPSKYQAFYTDGSEDLAPFEEAYPRLKRAFDAIEAAIKNIPTGPNIDGNPADPPSRPIDRVQLDQTGCKNGAAEIATTKSDPSDPSAPSTPVPNPPKNKGKGRELIDAGKDGRVQEIGTSDQHELVADDVSEPMCDEKE